MKQIVCLALTIVVGLIAQFGLSRFLEANQTQLHDELDEQNLPFKAETLKRISFGFDGLWADYYWISSLQYTGRKIGASQTEVNLDDLKSLDLKLLYPQLDAATTLDPDFTIVYSYGSTVLPAINVNQAIRIGEKGIAAHPENWRMFHNLGFVYWRAKDYRKAAETYRLGATKPQAPDWMQAMHAKVAAEGSSREAALEIYRQLYETAQNEQIKEVARRRLLQIQSLDERDAINLILRNFMLQNNRCAAGWREVYPQLTTVALPAHKKLRFSIAQEPLDPSQAPYFLNIENNRCEARINPEISLIPVD